MQILVNVYSNADPRRPRYRGQVMVGERIAWQGPWRERQEMASAEANREAQRIYVLGVKRGLYSAGAIGAAWPVDRH